MQIRRGGFIPNLCTLGNGVCGFAALIKAFQAQVVVTEVGPSFSNPEVFSQAAWLIVLGMLFDVFDGRLARLTGSTSDLGAQLDSLCDLTTFGLAPAMIAVSLNRIHGEMWGKVTWFFCLAYFLGAALRLARFNAETEHDESAHQCFRGLPSPAAAGCVASLVIFHRYIMDFRQLELLWLKKLVAPELVQEAVAWIPQALPLLMLILGYTMVSSRLKYDHVASRVFNRSQSFEFMVYLIFLTIPALLIPELVLPVVFIGYLSYTPLTALARAVRKARRPREDMAVETPQRPFP